MKSKAGIEKAFPLKRYYLLNAGIGAVLFYALLFSLLIRTQRNELYIQYVSNLTEKAEVFYSDVKRDFLVPRNLGFQTLNIADLPLMADFNKEITEVAESDFSISIVKVFNNSGATLFDSTGEHKVGEIYDAVGEASFQEAVNGLVGTKLEKENDGRRFMEVYLPVKDENTGETVAIIEIYEDVTRFEKNVANATKNILIYPTLVFIVFNLLLYLIVFKADGIIRRSTELLIAIRKDMEKYLSKTAVDAICESVSSKTELFKGKRENIVVFFSDIRGFTSFSESREPESVVQELNKLFRVQADIIHQHGGIIDKFVGDEIMAVFPESDSEKAVTASLDIMKAIENKRDIPFKVGVGIHFGAAVVGTIGAHHRRDYTAIGDTVNIGARLCGLAKPGETAVSADLYERLGDAAMLYGFSQKTVAVKGKKLPITIYVLNS